MAPGSSSTVTTSFYGVTSGPYLVVIRTGTYATGDTHGWHPYNLPQSSGANLTEVKLSVAEQRALRARERTRSAIVAAVSRALAAPCLRGAAAARVRRRVGRAARSVGAGAAWRVRAWVAA